VSTQAMKAIMQRAHADAGFYELLHKCPAAILDVYAVTAIEKAALLSGDSTALEGLGVAPATARDWTALDGLS
jgi:hypothetical protein